MHVFPISICIQLLHLVKGEIKTDSILHSELRTTTDIANDQHRFHFHSSTASNTGDIIQNWRTLDENRIRNESHIFPWHRLLTSIRNLYGVGARVVLVNKVIQDEMVSGCVSSSPPTGTAICTVQLRTRSLLKRTRSGTAQRKKINTKNTPTEWKITRVSLIVLRTTIADKTSL